VTGSSIIWCEIGCYNYQMTAERPLLAQASTLVDLGIRACEVYGRPDLAARLAATGRALGETTTHVVVIGDFKRGKSSLVNALVGSTVCPVDDNAATAVPTYVRHGGRAEADLLFAGDPPRRQSIAIEEAGRFAVEAGPGGGGASPGGGGVSSESGDSELVGVEIRIPCDLLAGGLVLVDTPGVGGLGSPQATASLAALSMADAALFVTDAEQELTPTELEVLRQARELCDTIACVLTKTDFYPGWRTVRAVDERHLGGSMYPASAPLRLHATETRDAALDAESGFADLVDFLAAQVRGAAARTAARAAADVMVACDLIAGAFEAGRASLTDPVAIEELLDVAKLTGELDHDLRTRIDRVIADLDQAIDGGDPADTWPQMTAWLQSRVSHEAIENFIMLCRRANDATVGTPATVALKRAYGGAFRIGMFRGLAGVALDDIDVGIGLLLGHQSLRAQKERQQSQRRTQAKQAVRRYCDKVAAVVGNDSREALRRIHDQLHVGPAAPPAGAPEELDAAIAWLRGLRERAAVVAR